jgi:two-component system OmpR family sensor kinase
VTKKTHDAPIKTELLVHDLKVPISVIDAGAKSLLNRQDIYGTLTEKQIKVIKRILRNTLTTQRLVNDILELGRSREGVMICVEFMISSLVSEVLVELFDLFDPDIAESVRNAKSFDDLNAIVKEKGTQLCFDPHVWQARVCLDQAKVRQILRNLLTNAFKHRSSFVELSGDIKDDLLTFIVKDDGRGIPQGDHEKIFQTYFTEGGSMDSTIQSHGLGLAGVMVLLRDMGGKLRLISQDGDGARFVVSIPT